MDRIVRERANYGKVLIAAGGTGGHLFPARALAEELLSKGLNPALVTDTRGEHLLGGSVPVTCYVVSSAGFAGKSPIGFAGSVLKMVVGIREAWRLIRTVRPIAVVGFGGYASVPLITASKLARVPSVIHESNAVLGRANRFLAHFSDAVAVSFPRTLGSGHLSQGVVFCTGTPVRKEIRAIAGSAYQASYGSSTIHLFVVGGSQGSKAMAKIVPDAVAKLGKILRKRLIITQQVRSDDKSRVEAAYHRAGVSARVHLFIENMREVVEKSHLVVARAGGSTIAELSVSGRPSILIPLPTAVDDHQTHNARRVIDAGAGWLLEEGELNADHLSKLLTELLGSPARLSVASDKARLLGKPHAAECLAGLLIKLSSVSSQECPAP